MAGLSRPAGPSDPVDIVLRVLGQIVVYDMADILYVNATRGYICSHQNLDSAILILLHQSKTFALRQIAGDAFGRQAVSTELFREPHNADLSVDKDKKPAPILPLQ